MAVATCNPFKVIASLMAMCCFHNQSNEHRMNNCFNSYVVHLTSTLCMFEDSQLMVACLIGIGGHGLRIEMVWPKTALV